MHTPPRIVHVYKDVYPPIEGGIERIIYHLTRLTAGSFEPRVVVAARTWRAGRRELAPGVLVEEVPSAGRLLSTPLAPGFIAALRRSGADLFHFHIPHPTGELAFLLSNLHTPAVATYHSDVVRQRAAMVFYQPLFESFLRRLSVIMPTSARYLETSPFLAAHRDRCRVVPLGYPLEDYALTPGVEARAGALRTQHGEFVLFLGCLRAYKGLEFLIEALTRLPGVRSVIAGEGPQRPVLEAQCRRLGLAGRVHFAGRVDQAEAVALLHAAAMFVLPAHQRSEAFGLCQIEAMACGLPVISTDLPTGVPEVNAHGISGLIVPPADPEALAGAIGSLMADPARRRAMGEAGHRRAHEHYQARRMAEDVMAVYRQVLGL
jgi:glycosyltransferase involved in cell wall biosynthesis